jgi:hypothetical protein
MLAAQPDKSILNVYNFQKVSGQLTLPGCKNNVWAQDQIALKIVLPEKLTCLAVDKRGEFCAGGTAQGRIYLWEVCLFILPTAADMQSFCRWLLEYYTTLGMRITAKLPYCGLPKMELLFSQAVRILE